MSIRTASRTDTVTGYRYIVALPAHGLEKLGVRIDLENSILDKPDEFAAVISRALTCVFYESQGHAMLTAKATGIAIRKS